MSLREHHSAPFLAASRRRPRWLFMQHRQGRSAGVVDCGPYDHVREQYDESRSTNKRGGHRRLRASLYLLWEKCYHLHVSCPLLSTLSPSEKAGSLTVSRIWGVCPNTQPALLGADTWYNAVIAHDWDICGPYLENYDCAGALGYGASSAGNTTQFYKPGDLPANGTETLSNTGGVISTPISGSTFTWTLGTVPHPVTAMAATATATANSGKSGSTATGAAAAATTKSESAARYTSAPIMAVSGVVAFTLALLKVA